MGSILDLYCVAQQGSRPGGWADATRVRNNPNTRQFPSPTSHHLLPIPLCYNPAARPERYFSSGFSDSLAFASHSRYLRTTRYRSRPSSRLFLFSSRARSCYRFGGLSRRRSTRSRFRRTQGRNIPLKDMKKERCTRRWG